MDKLCNLQILYNLFFVNPRQEPPEAYTARPLQ